VRARATETKEIGAVEQGDVLAFQLKPNSFLTEQAFPLTAARKSQQSLHLHRHLRPKPELCTRQLPVKL
jgi:hypothetical protein